MERVLPAHHIDLICRAGYLFARRTFIDLGLNGADHEIIEHMRQHPGTSQEGVRLYCNKDKGTIAKAMTRPEEHGCLYREVYPENKGENRVCLTEQGKGIMARIESMKEEWRSVLMDGFPEEEQAPLWGIVLQGRPECHQRY